MKAIVLSDHAGDMIAREQGGRQRQYDNALKSHRKAEGEWSRRVEAEYQRIAHNHREELDRWSKMTWLRRLLYGLIHSWPVTLLCVAVMGAGLYVLLNGIAFWLAVVGLVAVPGIALLYFPGQEPSMPSRSSVERRFGKAPKRPVPSPERTQSETVWEAGAEGERRVADRLAAQLDDQWTMLSGYNGSGGEIDRIIVGPLGACALEIKYLNGNVTVNGDSWLISRYDSYGNEVEHYQPMTDKAGHSPSQQLNMAVKPLQDFLSQRKLLRRMVTAVVLSHDRSFIEVARNQAVDNVTALPHLRVRDLFSQSKQPPLSPEAAARVVQHIQRDHEFHKNRRSQSGKQRRGGRARPTDQPAA